MSVLVNGDFSDGFTGWTFHAPKGSSFDIEHGMARLEVATRSDNIQLYQAGVVLEPETRYLLTFTAAANGTHTLAVHMHRNGVPYDSFGLANYIADVDREAKSFATYFTTPKGVLDDGRLRIWLAPYADKGSVYRIGHVSLVKAVEEPLPEPEQQPRRVIHVIARTIMSGDTLEVRYVPPDKIKVDERGDIDWNATPWRMVAVYAPDTD